MSPSSSEQHVQKAQCKKAVEALVKHAQKKSEKLSNKDLLNDEQSEKLFLVITLKREYGYTRHKPIQIPLPHPVMNPKDSPVCLLTKDPQREYKDLLSELDIKFIDRVIGVTKLKGKHKPFEARRELMRQHDLFLADDRIVPALPKLLGKKWLDKKRPIPVSLKKKQTIKAELEKAIASSYLYLGLGTCITVKIGTLGLSDSDALQENLMSAIENAIPRLPFEGWNNVQALHIKTSTSTSLPIYNSVLGDNDDTTSRFYSGAPTTKKDESASEAESENDSDNDKVKSVKKRNALDKDAVKEGTTKLISSKKEKDAGKPRSTVSEKVKSGKVKQAATKQKTSKKVST